VRLFYILSKNKIFRILTKIFFILLPKQPILNKYLVNLYSKSIFVKIKNKRTKPDTSQGGESHKICPINYRISFMIAVISLTNGSLN